MTTPRIAPDLKTSRKYVRAWVRLERANLPLTERQERDLEVIRIGLAHWYSDDLQEWDCPCDACEWWKAQIHLERRARNYAGGRGVGSDEPKAPTRF